MAIYPDDAVVPQTAYVSLASGTGTISINNSTGPFTLPNGVSVRFAGEVIVANSNGETLPTNTYYLYSPTQIMFYSSPANGTYTLRCIDLPARYRVVETSPDLVVSTVRYTTTPISVGGNTYSTSGSTLTFSLPEQVLGSLTPASQIFVYKNGLLQSSPTSYTYPSVTLSYNGIKFATAPTNAAVEIRAFATSMGYTTRFSSMKQRKPNNGTSINTQMNVSKYSTQAGYEKRRLLSRRPRRTFQITYTNVSGLEKLAVENFYRARNGEFETFTFDLTHINDNGTLRTRFNGPLEIQHVASRGIIPTDNFYNIRLSLQEDFD